MTTPIFNENWEHLPVNPICLQPQLTANSTDNDNAYKRKFATLKSYFTAFGNIWEQIWVCFCQLQQWQCLFYRIWEQIWGCLRLYLLITLTTEPISQHLVTFGNKSEAVFCHLQQWQHLFYRIWEQIWGSLRPYLSITLMALPISQHFVTFGNKSKWV